MPSPKCISQNVPRYVQLAKMELLGMEEKLLVVMDIVNITALSGAIVAMVKSIR